MMDTDVRELLEARRAAAADVSVRLAQAQAQVDQAKQELAAIVQQYNEAIAAAHAELERAGALHREVRYSVLGLSLDAISAVIVALDAGAKPIVVRDHRNTPLGGAIVRRTPTRVYVLTERGTMVFELAPRASWKRAGQGTRAWWGYRIDPVDVEE